MPQETDILALNSALLSGGIALLPTETVYGLGADARNQTAVNKLYHAKGRDFDKPIAICVRDIKAATSLVHWSETAQQLAERFWPGPLSIVLPAKDGLGLDKRLLGRFPDGSPSLSLRCPQTLWHEKLDIDYLALTSANKSGQSDIIDFKTAFDIFSHDVDAALDAALDNSGGGAPSAGGKASTIIAIKDGKCRLLRSGVLSPDDFAGLKLIWDIK
jgi:L-threonylcarbamoyladenylate synthase